MRMLDEWQQQQIKKKKTMTKVAEKRKLWRKKKHIHSPLERQSRNDKWTMKKRIVAERDSVNVTVASLTERASESEND